VWHPKGVANAILFILYQGFARKSSAVMLVTDSAETEGFHCS
jgi:hypothetical protein